MAIQLAPYKERNNKRRDENLPELREAVDDIYRLLGALELLTRQRDALVAALLSVREAWVAFDGSHKQLPDLAWDITSLMPSVNAALALIPNTQEAKEDKNNEG